MLNPPTSPRLLLIRGLPGSGKSTMALDYQRLGYRHVEADQFFMVDGKYLFDAERLSDAHTWCLDQARMALKAGEFICVSNVFATVVEITPYAQLGVDYQIVEATHAGRSIHNAPPAKLRVMKSKWIPTPELLKALSFKVQPSPTTLDGDISLPDLTFPMVSFGFQQTPWDLRVLLFKGGAKADHRGAQVFLSRTSRNQTSNTMVSHA